MTAKFSRYYNIEKFLKPNEALIIFGPRQAGKTTLLGDFLNKTSLKYKLDSGDDVRVREILGSQNISKIKEYIAGYNLYAIDEAQKIPNIGEGLKIIVDHIPNIKIIATGSSSFELLGQIGEPLTGRKKTVILYPLSQLELSKFYVNLFELNQELNQFLIFGSYPKVLTADTKSEKQAAIEEITNSYLLKDILEIDKIKNSKVIIDLLRFVAFQIGQEVSISEIGTALGLNKKTISRYLDLLEKSFVIFNLRGFSRNLRKEITKKSKYYFYDNGIRNAIISNFNDLEKRDDIGKIWENFLVSERLKTQKYLGIASNNYFWRTWDQKEIDWIEEREGKLFGFEFKFSKNKSKIPGEFQKTYPNSEINIITRDNYMEFLNPS